MTLCVNFGGGVNSTAMLVGLHQRNERPDLIVFADTGGERPETYRHIDEMSSWLAARDFPSIEVTRWIRQDGSWVSLEQACIDRKELPSLAYGFKGCSVKWKAQPADKLVRERLGVSGVVRCIGFDAGEAHRIRERESEWLFRYPLVEWWWDRARCLSEIKKSGAPMPSKSSCFFCPATRRHEVVELSKAHPDLYERAIAIERNAETRTVVGLGRSWSWEEAVRTADKTGDLFAPEIACECFDGDQP